MAEVALPPEYHWTLLTPTQSIFEAGIEDLQHALSRGAITSVELVAKHLLRVFTYDSRGPCLNSIPIINPDVFEEAAASDARRRDGKALGMLDGIPYTIKDSMMYKGMTCATGSPAFKNLVANKDSFVAERLRAAGAVCIGRTNTPPMMASGMHRGEYGRAESPYNLEYLTAAFSSGSSNGSGTSTAASFAAFGLGSETVSSGRSPASNNGLVAYTPSRTVISPRGVWPLYPTCDVHVPQTRTVKDMMAILDTLAVEESTTEGDFWRQQDYVEVPKVPRPASFLELIPKAKDCFKGKRIAVPEMYIGGNDPKAKPTAVSQNVIDLFRQARKDVEALGATVIETDFPLVTNYEDDSVTGQANNVVGFKPDWNGKERGELVAFLWDDFLKSSGDPKFAGGLAAVDGTQMFPRPEGYIPDRYMEVKNFINYPGIVELCKHRNGKSIWEIDGIAEALPALEAQRKRDFEGWMDRNGIDGVVFPANGDVGKADLEYNDQSAKQALQNGVKYSNGNRAIRHMGVPTVSVSMGVMAESRMPVNLTFAGKHAQDSELLKYAWAFENLTRRRITSPVTPELQSDRLTGKRGDAIASSKGDSELHFGETSVRSNGNASIELTVRLSGSVSSDVGLEAFVDGKAVPTDNINASIGVWTISTDVSPFDPAKPLYGGVGLVVGNFNVILLARSGGRVSGKLVMVPQSILTASERHLIVT
ncbi:uncharacterized protein LTR77_007849 [Saxophila tyrrhenica]|uniref:Amidase domain-containing protein n=1 Tax=Saxophila tyrrhenica TaxID=1690608 RepID=A0AAV9P3A5_9PEZI|nr:hypothetical protein LTR77_007849 [Saxophila tyrrhenica]